MQSPTITIPQDRETVASRDIAPGPIAFTYVYARSRDTRQAGSVGQDFIAYRYDEEQIVFAVCDGVSQSFYGEIAARFLGLHLVDLLSRIDTAQTEPFLEDVNAALQDWTANASTEVQAKQINPNLPEMQRIALERKRENGSESMFVAGRVDRQGQRVALCWMGDMRLWLWDAEGRTLDIPGAVWETRERWSTRLGPKNGKARGCVLPLGEAVRLTAHSDGVGHYGAAFAQLSQDMLNSMVDELGRAAASDDISVFDIDLAVRPLYGDFMTLRAPILHLPDAAEPVLTWGAVPLASRYRVLIDDGRAPYTQDVEATTYFPPHAPEVELTCAVQALNDYAFPSPWSERVILGERSAVAEPLPISPVTESPAIESSSISPAVAVEAPKLSAAKPKRPRQAKGRVAASLTILLSALLLIAIILAVWIVVVIVGWNDFVQLIPGR